MKMEVLSLGESLSLCRAAAILVSNRFQWLARQTEQGDRKLSQLFGELAGEVERNLNEIHHLDGLDRPPGASEREAGQEVARGFLPSLSKSIDGVRVDRESGFYLMECLLEDLAQFYGALVRQCSDEKSRDLLLRLKLAVKGRLEFLQHVVL